MITEDYVSFETAKLLKEKGFDEITFTWYTGKGKFCVGKNNFDDYHVNHLSNMASAIDKNKCSAPTLQMAMKWLRKEHKIGVFPSTYCFSVGVNGSVKHVYGTAIINLETHELMTNDIMPMPTYEEATEAAIKYCLNNLI